MVMVATVVFALAPVGLASADCTVAGDFGAGSGCPPPGGGSGGDSDSWPPTGVDWPPGADADSGGSDSDGHGSDKPAPIVMPAGQEAPPSDASSPSTSSTPTPTPIVPVGAPPG